MEHEGLPPGYAARDQKLADKQRAHRQDQRAKRVSQSMAEIASTMGTEILSKSVLVEYDANDLPIIPEPQRPDPVDASPPPQQRQPPRQQAAAEQRQPPPTTPSRQMSSPPQPHPATQRPEELAAVHPVLAKMLRTFGLSNTKSFSIDLFSAGGVKVSYAMTLLPEEATAAAIADSKSRQDLGTENQIAYFQNLFVSMAIVSIDGEPVWKIFGLEPTKEELAVLDRDPKNVPVRLRKDYGRQLAELFWTELGPLADKLWTFYEEVVAKENKVTSSYEREQDDLLRYICPLDGCTVVEFQKPRWEDGEEQPYFCKVHGTMMVKAIELGAAEDLPLA